MTPDDYTIAATAAQTVIAAEIKQFVPAMFQSRIPPEDVQSMANAIAHAVVDALNAAHKAST